MGAGAVGGKERKRLAGIYLLYSMLEEDRRFDVLLPGDDKYLEVIFEGLLAGGLVEIKDGKEYAATLVGEEVYRDFSARYRDFLRHFDVFCAVDLGRGEFAFEKYFEFESESGWADYISEQRWDDLRVVVAGYKGIDTLEVVFMSFLNEGRLKLSKARGGWQFDLALGTFWEDIHGVCDSALEVGDLGYEADGEFISGEAVLIDVMERGAIMNRALFKAELEFEEAEGGVGGVDRGALEEDYKVFDGYEKDAKYVSPCWRGGGG